MHIKIILVFGISALLIGCKNNQDNQTTEITIVDNSQKISQKDIEKLDYTEFLLDEQALKQSKDWLEYTKLQEILDHIKKGDLNFFTENVEIIFTSFNDFKTNTPQTLKSPSITARILVIETKLHKLESLVNLSTTSKQELQEGIKELLIAFSNLNLQINKKVEFDAINIKKP